MEEIVVKYLIYLGIPVSRKYCKKLILSHPDYPSLLSIADTLERLGIDHQAGQLETKTSDELPFPCIIHLNKGGGQLTLLKDQNDFDLLQSDLDAWEGVVLKAKPNESITDEEHNKQYAEEKDQRKLSAVLVITLLGLTILPVLQMTSWLYFSLFATSVGGAVVGYVLLAKDLGITYKPVETFCNTGKSSSCDRILNAEEANLFSFFTLTDAAASYFIFQVIIVGLFIPLYNSLATFLWILAGAAALTIPVIGYSLYYQYVKAKTWCRLCLIVGVILGLQAGLFAIMFVEQMFALTSTGFLSIGVSVMLFTAVATSILLIKSQLKISNASRTAETAAKRVKHDPKIFMRSLLEEKKIDITAFNKEMCIGVSNAPIEILMAASFGCSGCKEGFEQALQVVKTYPERVNLRIRFLPIEAEDEFPFATKDGFIFGYWLQYIQGKDNEAEKTEKLIRDWFYINNIKKIRQKYSKELSKELVQTAEKLGARHYEWFSKENIRRTPLFFVNSYKLPKNYGIKDLMGLIPGMNDFFKKQEVRAKQKAKEFA